jgi:hypothetical protein
MRPRTTRGPRTLNKILHLNVNFVNCGKAVMTVTTEAGPWLKHRERAKYKGTIYDALKNGF